MLGTNWKILALSFVLVVFACGSMLCAEDDAAVEMGGLRGSWRVVSVRIDGKMIPSEDWEMEEVWGFADGKVTGLPAGWRDTESVLKIFADKTPKQFQRFAQPYDELLWFGKGIYSVSGDKLTWCEVFPDGPVPRSFDANKQDGRTLIILQRVKK